MLVAKKPWVTLLSLPFILQAVPQMPHWYQNAPKGVGYFYGSGMADTKEEAKQKALNDLASSISVHVSSSTTSNTTRIDKKITKHSSQNIQLIVDSIKFVNVQTDKEECYRHACYTRLRLDKNTFLNLLSKRYTEAYNTLAPLKPAKECRGIFIKQKQQIQSVLDKLLPLQEILSAYGRAYMPVKFYQNIIKDNSPKPKANLVFSNGADNEISDAITGQYARFIQQTDDPGYYRIENKIYTSEGNGQFHIGLDINIKNCQGNIIYSKHLNADQNTRGAAIERIKAQVFKQMRNYQNGVGAGTADVNSDKIEF
ncbi:LPP20 family lipoprotein [Helicobacter suis]|uniref:LPP20 family lipoprotein n=1 Tax=Helicobacter suis TaxID=104628 RepID=UPI0013D759E9|nr:LPP20 family lipoprotein [Helicobacter suis]